MDGNSVGRGLSFEKCFIDMLQCREIIFVFLVLLMYFAKFYCKLYNPCRLALLYVGCVNLFDGNYFNKMMMVMMCGSFLAIAISSDFQLWILRFQP